MLFIKEAAYGVLDFTLTKVRVGGTIRQVVECLAVLACSVFSQLNASIMKTDAKWGLLTGTVIFYDLYF